jgi:hypothetical protein
MPSMCGPKTLVPTPSPLPVSPPSKPPLTVERSQGEIHRRMIVKRGEGEGREMVWRS